MVLCIGAVGLSGCAETDDDGAGSVTPAMIKADARDLEKEGYSEQAEMLSDGVVTAREYADAFDLLRTCVEANDGKVVDLQVNPVDGISLSFAFETADLPGIDKALDDCQFRYWTTLEMDYRESHLNKMDPLLRDAVSECMKERGIESTGEEDTVQDFAGEAGLVDGVMTPRAQAASDCIQEQVVELFGAGGSFAFE
jgi:hypothetical protein